MTSDRRSSDEKAESGHQSGSGDGLIDLMRHCNLPITRANYLDLAYSKDNPIFCLLEDDSPASDLNLEV
jgi:hypothetical protein